MSDFDGEQMSIAMGPAAVLVSTRITSRTTARFEPVLADLRLGVYERFGRFVVGLFVVGLDECIDMRLQPLNGGELATGQRFAPKD